MADNFLQAINTGINLGHMADSARMQRQQMERLAEQMQFNQLKQGLEMEALLAKRGEREFSDWGYGQKRDKRTGEILEVPTAPKEKTGSLKALYDANGKVSTYVIANPGDPAPEGLSWSKPEQEKQDEFTDWGYGQKKNKKTGEIVKVPTAPHEPPNPDMEGRELTKEQKRNLIAERKLKMKFGVLPSLNTLTGETVYPINPLTDKPFKPQEWAIEAAKAYGEVMGAQAAPSSAGSYIGRVLKRK